MNAASRLVSLALHAAVLGAVLAWHSPGGTPDAEAIVIPVTLVIAASAATAASAEAPREAAPPPAAAEPSAAAAIAETPPQPSPLPERKRKPRRAVAAAAPTAAPDPGEAQVPAPQAGADEPPPAAPSASAAPTAASAVASASPPAARAAGPGADYLAEIVAWLARYKRYPDEARRRHDEGTVLIAFAIARDGRVLSSAVRGGSGSAALDAAAKDMIRRADPLPAPPASYPGEHLELVLPVTFSLE